MIRQKIIRLSKFATKTLSKFSKNPGVLSSELIDSNQKSLSSINIVSKTFVNQTVV